MGNFNDVGRTVREVELKVLQGGTSMASFTIAIDRFNAKKLKEEGKQATDFINCTSFGKQADFVAEHLGKGKLVKVEGDLRIDKVDDKYYTKVNCSSVRILEWKDKQDTSSNDGFEEIGFDESSDIPF